MSPFDSNLFLLCSHARRELQGCERQIDKNRKLIARIERWTNGWRWRFLPRFAKRQLFIARENLEVSDAQLKTAHDRLLDYWQDLDQRLRSEIPR